MVMVRRNGLGRSWIATLGVSMPMMIGVFGSGSRRSGGTIPVLPFGGCHGMTRVVLVVLIRPPFCRLWQ